MIKSPVESVVDGSSPLTGKAVIPDHDTGKRSSYSVQTLKRILLLSSVTKQTTSTSDKSKTMLQSRLQSEAGTTQLQSEVDTAILTVDRTRSRLRGKSDSLLMRQQASVEAGHRIKCRQAETTELVNRMRITSDHISNLKRMIEQEKNKLSAARESLEKRRGRLIQELAGCIYPVAVDTAIPTIGGFMLPDISSPAAASSGHNSAGAGANGVSTPSPYSWSKFFGTSSKTGISEEGLSIAVGNVTHMLLLISKFTDIPLKYDLVFGGSRSHVIDHLNIETWKQILGQMGSPSPADIAGADARDRFSDRSRKRNGVQVSLYIQSKGSKDSRVYFDYGLFLLNQIIAQIKWTLSCLHRRNGRLSESFRKIDLTQTLTNLHDILSIYSNFLIESNSNFTTSSPNHNASVTDGPGPASGKTVPGRSASPEPSVSGLRRGSRSSSLPPPLSTSKSLHRDEVTFLNREMEAMLNSQDEISTGDRSSSVSTSDELLTSSSRSQSVPHQINSVVSVQKESPK
jgi:hypothetical protein